MKSKDLIKQLQELDPTGDVEVCVGSVDIFTAMRVPAYYDGALEVLIRDDSKKPYYDVTGVKITYEGEKINLQTLSISDVLEEDFDAIVQYELPYLARQRWEQKISKIKDDIIRNAL
jgi:hypothetical protein